MSTPRLTQEQRNINLQKLNDFLRTCYLNNIDTAKLQDWQRKLLDHLRINHPSEKNPEQQLKLLMNHLGSSKWTGCLWCLNAKRPDTNHHKEVCPHTVCGNCKSHGHSEFLCPKNWPNVTHMCRPMPVSKPTPCVSCSLSNNPETH